MWVGVMEQSTRMSVIVVETICDALETPVEELPPLSNQIDLDALDGLMSVAETEPSSDVTVSFTYAGLHVMVFSNKTVYVRPINCGGEGPLENDSF